MSSAPGVDTHRSVLEMEAVRLFLLLTNICLCTRVQPVQEFENLYSENGWRPITSNILFNDKWNNQNILWNNHDQEYDRALKYNILKVIDPPQLAKKIVNYSPQTETLTVDDTGPTSENHNKYSINEVAIDYILQENSNDTGNNLRKSRTMSPGYVYHLKDINEINVDNQIKNKLEEQITTDYKKQYEVVEDVDSEELLQSDQKISLVNSNKNEVTDNVKQEPKKFTKNLINILSNYNIRASDKLENYALSLRQNGRDSNSHDYAYVRVPFWMPLKYNNANHLPVDPLLAVFLSNYGYYVPGFYGIKQNYKNRYGYLASNNIHNNKPFGAYKIFSDTDPYL